MHDRGFPAIAAFGLVLLLLPLPFHVRGGNTGLQLLFFWVGTVTLIYFINSVVWFDNYEIRIPVWCDITSKLLSAASIGGPCSSLIVLRQLESIASTRSVTVTSYSRRKRLIKDLLLGLGVPFIFASLVIVYQGHRFDLAEGIGCIPTYYWTPVTIVLYAVPPLVVSIVSLVYAALCLRWFIIRRRQLSAVLQSSCTGINKSKYIRLMGLSICEAIWSLPLSLSAFALNLSQHTIQPYISWENVHDGFNNIVQYPAETWDLNHQTKTVWQMVELGRYSMPVSCFLVLAFFGTSEEVIAGYKRAIVKALAFIGVSRKEPAVKLGQQSYTTPTLPHLSATSREKDLDFDEEKSIALTPRTPMSGMDRKSSDGFVDDFSPTTPTTPYYGSRLENTPSQGVSVTVERLVN